MLRLVGLTLFCLGLQQTAVVEATTCSKTVTCQQKTTTCDFYWAGCWWYADSYKTGTCENDYICTTVWNDWEPCTASCGGGKQKRSGTCSAGETCSVAVSDERQCNTHTCPQHGGWSRWLFQGCTPCETCGNSTGKCEYLRRCDNPPALYGGKPCEGKTTRTDIENCYKDPCPIDGGWTSWTDWKCDDCSNKLCSKTRTCSNPEPAWGGVYCDGDHQDTQYQTCKPDVCHANGGWGSYDSTVVHNCGRCSKTCGGGKQACELKRSCLHAPCEGSDTLTIHQSCNTHDCPAWSHWYEGRCDECQGECTNRTRTCLEFRVCSGQDCPDDDIEETETTRRCEPSPCKVDGGWSPARGEGILGPCNVTCGVGIRNVTRVRKCDNPRPANGGADCKGSSLVREVEECKMPNCPAKCRVECASVDPEVTVMFSDPSMCNVYHQCRNGRKFTSKCQKGLLYNDAEKRCDYPENVNCNMCEWGYLNCMTEEGDIECADPSTGCRDGTTEIEFGPIYDDAHQCSHSEANMRIADGAPDCGGYFICVYNVWMHMACAKGTHFDGQVCGHAQCSENPSPEVNCVNNTKHHDDSRDCSGYTECSNNHLYYHVCPDFTRYDEVSGECKHESDVECAGYTEESGECSGDEHQLLPHETYCNLFYQCDHGVKVEKRCGNEEHPYFEPELQVCVHLSESSCVRGLV